jgi:hypothetical protein
MINVFFAQVVGAEQFCLSGPKIPTHTIHIPQIPSNILQYRTLMFKHTSVADVTSDGGAISSVFSVKIKGNFCSHDFKGAKRGWGYSGGKGYIGGLITNIHAGVLISP